MKIKNENRTSILHDRAFDPMPENYILNGEIYHFFFPHNILATNKKRMHNVYYDSDNIVFYFFSSTVRPPRVGSRNGYYFNAGYPS